MASTHATDSMEFKFKIPKWAAYLIVAVLVLAAAYILGSTLKERVTDPAIEKAAGLADDVAVDTGLKLSPIEEEALARAKEKVVTVANWSEGRIDSSEFTLTTRKNFLNYVTEWNRDDFTQRLANLGPGDEAFYVVYDSDLQEEPRAVLVIRDKNGLWIIRQ